MSRAQRLLEESNARTFKTVALIDKARRLSKEADKKSMVNKVADKAGEYAQKAKPHVQSAIHAISTHPKTALATAGALGAGAVASKLRRNRKAKEK